jgi:hypothetical protein
MKDVFFDLKAIPAGADFATLISRRIGQCDVLIAVVGDAWIDVRDETDGRRLDPSDDFVRAEIRATLEGNKLVVLVLVRGAKLLRRVELPATLPNGLAETRLRLESRHLTRMSTDLSRSCKQRPRALALPLRLPMWNCRSRPLSRREASTQAMKISCTPRFFRSVTTCSQYLATSV